MGLLIILLMLLLNAFFSGSEIAFVAANRLRVEVLSRRGGLVGPIVHRFIDDPSTFLTTTLVGNNVALVVYSTLVAFYLDEPLARLFQETFGLAEVGGAVLITQTIIGAMVVLVIGEIIPKSIMRELANRMVFVLAVPLQTAYYVLLPMIKLAGWAAAGLVRLFHADASTFSQFLRRDFEIMIQEGRETGELDLDEEETEILSNVFALTTIRVKESMTPRTDVVAVEQQTSLDDVQRMFIESGYSKLPVYRENIDNIVGVAFAHDLFQEPTSLSDIIRPAKFVPESKLSKDLLQEFLATDTSLAIVIDEYGGTAGLVTREDLLEELFGDIQDEFDTVDVVLRRVGEDTFILSGRVEVDTLREQYGVDLPDGDYETVAGYLLERLGAIPTPQEQHELDGHRFTILQATANRIDLVRLVVGAAAAL